MPDIVGAMLKISTIKNARLIEEQSAAKIKYRIVELRMCRKRFVNR